MNPRCRDRAGRQAARAGARRDRCSGARGMIRAIYAALVVLGAATAGLAGALKSAMAGHRVIDGDTIENLRREGFAALKSIRRKHGSRIAHASVRSALPPRRGYRSCSTTAW